MMAQRTPGPWHYERGTFRWAGYHTVTAAHAGMGPSTPLAVLSPILDEVDPGAEADARLIAAAPDLLEELRHCGVAMDEAANLIRPNFPRVATIFEKGAERVRAVIAKADGAASDGERSGA